jgi:hypothetical protein
LAFRKLTHPAKLPVYHVVTCDFCGGDLQDFSRGYQDDFYPRIRITAEGSGDDDAARWRGTFCSINCARSWLTSEIAEYCPGWIEARSIPAPPSEETKG